MPLTNYKISHELPPVYDRCVELWGVSFDNTVWTYGDTIYCKNMPSDNLLAHELVHVKQQTLIGADEWWMKYFADPEFRLSQEVEAYRAQYKHFPTNNREIKARVLVQFAQALSGEMYGKIITFGEAVKLISK